MSALSAGANLAAIQELKDLFCTADHAHTGLLSYSEFAYLILRSGGTQEQVDALIEQFAAPPRAKRMVCYAALLDQLYDSIEAIADARRLAKDSSAIHKSDPLRRASSLDRTPSMPPNDTSDHSPSPIPPGPARSAPPSWSARLRSIDGDGYTTSASLASRGASGVHLYDPRPAASSPPPLGRSVTHPGASGSGTTIRVSRASSTEACATYNINFKRPLRSQSSPCSSRFVESALRVAHATASLPPEQQRLHRASSWTDRRVSVSASRSKSHSDVHGAKSVPRYTTGTPHYPSDPTPLDTVHRRRESSIERMTRVAAEVSSHGRPQPHLGTEDGTGAGEKHEVERKRGSSSNRVLPDTPPSASSWSSPASSLHPATSNGAIRTAAPQVKRTNSSSFESRPSKSPLRSQDHIAHSTECGSIAAVPLLSLRDIFRRYLAPLSSRDGTVLLSEFWGALATRGVEVHPLELDAVAESLELRAAPVDVEHHDNSPHHHSLNTNSNGSSRTSASTVARMRSDLPHTRSLINALDPDRADASPATANRSTTVITGSADRVLNLVDFCVLVSRLRPVLIQRIRSASVWETTPSIGAAEVPQSRQPPHGSAPIDARGTPDADDGDSEGGASIADVTVSPMTSATAASATPKSIASSLSPTPNASAHQCLQRRRPWDAAIARSAAALTSSSAAAPPPPPTARQLSKDRQFFVEYARCAPRRDRGRQAKCDGRRACGGYAPPTAASQQRRRGLRTTPSVRTAVPHRPKVPVRHSGVRDSDHQQPPNSAACSPSITPSGGSWSPNSPDERQTPKRPQLHRGHVGRAELGAGVALRHHGGTFTPSPTAAVPRLSPASTSLSSPELKDHREPSASRLAPRVLETLQYTALALLRRCAEIDCQRTGRIPPSAWLRVLQDASPALTHTEQLRVHEWIQTRGHGSADGDDYRAIVEDMLTEANLDSLSPASGVKRTGVWRDKKAASPSPHHARAATRQHIPQEQGSASRTSVSPKLTTTDASSAFSHRAATPRAAVPRGPRSGVPASAQVDTPVRAKALDKDAERQLAHELRTACGGDTEALLEYFRAFDKRDTGFVNEHVWRASLEELFRRTEERDAPAWVVSECMRLSRLPLETSLVPSSSSQLGSRSPASSSLSAARAFSSRVSPAMRRTLCSYRYVLERLGLLAMG
ncbi:hypothetical protein JKF63_04597 [Porcisia hertigi]|uniref:EF-hand domain-containing protein n=1 Tax=Porcisia hertigi TaxID=2761500 RepID=A0A836I0V3_9TRYP|nr:hypothetical protein JKF63_04597 [Porcisia hertigi]